MESMDILVLQGANKIFLKNIQAQKILIGVGPEIFCLGEGNKKKQSSKDSSMKRKEKVYYREIPYHYKRI